VKPVECSRYAAEGYGRKVTDCPTLCKSSCLTEQELAELAYPLHHPATALANYRSGREVWDTNGDMW
jgi:hypothetical protein